MFWRTKTLRLFHKAFLRRDGLSCSLMSVRESEDSMKADSLYCLSQELTLPRGFIYILFCLNLISPSVAQLEQQWKWARGSITPCYTKGTSAYLIFVTAQTRLQEIYIFITLQADFKGNTTGMWPSHGCLCPCLQQNMIKWTCSVQRAVWVHDIIQSLFLNSEEKKVFRAVWNLWSLLTALLIHSCIRYLTLSAVVVGQGG